MNRTKEYENMNIVKMAVTTEELAYSLGCGLTTAKKIGEESGAKLDLGVRRTLWHVETIQKYLSDIAC